MFKLLEKNELMEHVNGCATTVASLYTRETKEFVLMNVVSYLFLNREKQKTEMKDQVKQCI